jgi:hypothetical protein
VVAVKKNQDISGYIVPSYILCMHVCTNGIETVNNIINGPLRHPGQIRNKNTKESCLKMHIVPQHIDRNLI